MAIAQVNVLQEFRTESGWVKTGPATMDADIARAQPPGFVEILRVDGVVEVNAPCCGGTHDPAA